MGPRKVVQKRQMLATLHITGKLICVSSTWHICHAITNISSNGYDNAALLRTCVISGETSRYHPVDDSVSAVPFLANCKTHRF